MRVVSLFKNLNVTWKVNLLVLIGVGISTLMILFLVHSGIEGLLNETSSQQLNEEAEAIRLRFDESTSALLKDANFISRNSELIDHIIQGQHEQLQTLVRIQGGLYNLDTVYVITPDRELLSSLRSDDTISSEQNEMVSLSLLGIETTGVVEHQTAEGSVLQLVAVAPIRDLTGALIGSVLVANTLDQDFLATLNYQRENVDLLLIHDNTIFSQSAGSFQHQAREALTIGEDLSLNRIEQAANAHQTTQGDTQRNPDNEPYRAIYLPLEIGERSLPLVLVISLNEASLLDFRSELERGLFIAALFVGIAELLGFTFLMRWSVIRPLNQLVGITREMEVSPHGITADESTKDEIGRLGYAFNRMVEAIQQRETSLADLNASLEQQVEDRTAELRHQTVNLRIATAKAKEAARIKGEFMANVSHELRTPLNAIIGFSDMLLMGIGGELHEQQRHKVERLRENGVRLLNLVNNILDITRIEAKRIELTQKPFSPVALVDRLQKQMEALAEKKQLAFNTIVDPQLPATLIGDEQRIEQIVVNLLSNAFKFTDKGSVTLEVRANPAEKQWNIIVADTGIGIAPHSREVIFEEFRQLDGSSSRAYQGSGLGLAITNNLVRIMDGRIELKSDVGRGSTFSVVLPMVESLESEDETGLLETIGAE